MWIWDDIPALSADDHVAGAGRTSLWRLEVDLLACAVRLGHQWLPQAMQRSDVSVESTWYEREL